MLITVKGVNTVTVNHYRDVFSLKGWFSVDQWKKSYVNLSFIYYCKTIKHEHFQVGWITVTFYFCMDACIDQLSLLNYCCFNTSFCFVFCLWHSYFLSMPPRRQEAVCVWAVSPSMYVYHASDINIWGTPWGNFFKLALTDEVILFDWSKVKVTLILRTNRDVNCNWTGLAKSYNRKAAIIVWV